jgi:hypothetical protein
LIRGQSKLDGQAYDFEYRITCNSDDLYPGQLSRKVHMGLLRIMQLKHSFPFANPIQFTWRELMETLGMPAGGNTVTILKQAIRSTEGTRIRSKFALKNAHGKHLKGRERGYGLYSEYVFFDELLPDNETVADKNFVWLADWYLANINSLYCSPIDHEVWLALDDLSPIASRMYEFFTFNFAGDWKTKITSTSRPLWIVASRSLSTSSSKRSGNARLKRTAIAGKKNGIAFRRTSRRQSNAAFWRPIHR